MFMKQIVTIFPLRHRTTGGLRTAVEVAVSRAHALHGTRRAFRQEKPAFASKN